ncbi:MAG: hypothetical protein U5N86_04605 [Planctomycetota bacterium]|nr:hypothetical protein [Planctomycetota bacterium]
MRVARVLSARGQLPSPAEVIGEPDDRNAVVGWLNAALGAAKGE